MEKEQYQQTFQDILNGLNKQQRLAVDTIEGPVLVLAGPGTGKTQILAARIGNILQNAGSGIGAHNILCLTYTDAGTVAMQQRLTKFLGADAYKVSIHTFHSFCNQVIQENMDKLGRGNMMMVKQLDKVTIIQKMLDDLPIGHLLKRNTGTIYQKLEPMLSLFEQMKKEGWTEEYLLQKADEYLADLPFRDKYIYKKAVTKKGVKAGDLKKEDFDDMSKNINLFKAGVKQFETYNKRMIEGGYYDYYDMIIWAIEAFEKYPEILARYQEQYQYILVDEFQDTNGAQFEVLKHLISFWDDPNVFAVGDDDQSIFRFQGASVSNIEEFFDTYSKSLKTIILEENYRSSQQILDGAAAVISKNQQRLVATKPNLSKNLKASNPLVAGIKDSIRLMECHNLYHQVILIGKELEELYKSGYNLNEVAVIYRNHSHSAELINYLKHLGVPYNLTKKANGLDEPTISNFILLLSYINEEVKAPGSGDAFLYKILHLNFTGCSMLDAAQIAHKMRYSKELWREELYAISKENTTYYKNLKAPDALKKLNANIDFWISEAHNNTLQSLIESVLNRSGLLNYALRHPERVFQMELINSFFDFVKEENNRYPDLSLEALLETLNQMKANKLTLDVNKVSYQKNGVNFMTAHGSKGLEFERVYIFSANSKNWEESNSGNKGFHFPDNLIYKTKPTPAQAHEDERRLFYVAQTRAKKNLTISWNKFKTDGKDDIISQFVVELQDGTDLKPEYLNVSDEALLDYYEKVLDTDEELLIELFDDNHIDQMLEDYKLNPTHINSYLKCPVAFYFDQLLHVPAAKNEHMAFGSCIHAALEKFYVKLLENNNEVPEEADLLKIFEDEIFRNRESFPKSRLENRKNYGKEILSRFYKSKNGNWSRNVLLEFKTSSTIEGIPVSGMLDVIEMHQGKYSILDYKTGQYKKADAKLKPPVIDSKKTKPTFEEKFGGNYWRQAVMYKLMAENESAIQGTFEKVKFIFLEPNHEMVYAPEAEVHITPADEEMVKQQIKETYEKIMNHEFRRGCGEDNCDWCNFLKEVNESKK